MQEEHLRKGPWHKEEDEQLTSFVTLLGERRWDSLAKVAGLRRSGKSCRLRWMNYLRPNLKHGPFSVEEGHLIVQLQHEWGNKWSKIAQRLPGRTDNEIKNYWRSHLRKKSQVQQEGISFKYESENSAYDYSHKIIDDDMVSKENYMCDDETKENSIIIDTFGSSDWELTSSPYETRIFDWITELQNQCGETEQDHDCNNNPTYDYDLKGFEEGCVTLDYSDSLWNLN